MRERVRMWAGVVFGLLGVLERLAGRVGERRSKRSGRRDQSCEAVALGARSGAGFRGVSVLVLYQKANQK